MPFCFQERLSSQLRSTLATPPFSLPPVSSNDTTSRLLQSMLLGLPLPLLPSLPQVRHLIIVDDHINKYPVNF